MSMTGDGESQPVEGVDALDDLADALVPESDKPEAQDESESEDAEEAEVDEAEEEEAEPLAELSGALDIPADREHEPRVKLALALALSPSLFDGLDWSAAKLDADGVVDLGAPQNEALRKQLLEALAALKPDAEVSREDR